MLTDTDLCRMRAAGKTESEIHEILIEDQIMDERIKKAAYEEWLNILVSMWDAVDKEVDEKRLTYYAKEFEMVPFGLLEDAVKYAIRNNGKYLSVPSVSAIWDAIRKQVGDYPNMDILEVVELWKSRTDEQFNSSLCRFDQFETVKIR